MAKEKKKSSFSTLKFVLVIIVILLIPMVMEQMEMTEDDVRIAGRICGGIAGLFTLYGILTKVLKVFAFIVVALIALAVLVSEGVIEAPRIMELISSEEG
jgi:hypothetical protein